MNDAIKRKLIEANSKADQKARDDARRYEIIQAIRRGKAETPEARIPSEHEELATLRKTVDLLIGLVATQNGWDDTTIRETFRDFYEQTDIVNRAKQRVDKMLGIGGDTE